MTITSVEKGAIAGGGVGALADPARIMAGAAAGRLQGAKLGAYEEAASVTKNTAELAGQALAETATLVGEVEDNVLNYATALILSIEKFIPLAGLAYLSHMMEHYISDRLLTTPCLTDLPAERLACASASYASMACHIIGITSLLTIGVYAWKDIKQNLLQRAGIIIQRNGTLAMRVDHPAISARSQSVKDTPFVKSGQIFPSRPSESSIRPTVNSPIRQLNGLSTSSSKAPAGIAEVQPARGQPQIKG